MQVALRELEEAPERERLIEVITPVVYFLVLTSVVVHGITIPIVKGFTSAARRTITLTRSTGNSTSDLVSRLPQAPDSLPKAPHMFEVNMPNGSQQMMDSHDVADATREGEVRRHGGEDGPLHFHHHDKSKDDKERERASDSEEGSNTIQAEQSSSGGDENAAANVQDGTAKKDASTTIRFDVPDETTGGDGDVRNGRDQAAATPRKTAGSGPVSILTPSQSRVASRSGSPQRR